MNVPNPYDFLKAIWDSRAIGKIRDQYKISLQVYANRHSATKEKDDKFIIIGVLGYFGCLLISAWQHIAWLTPASFGVLIGSLMLPFAASYYEQWQLKSKLTLTSKIVADDPEETRPITIRLEGVWFGAPIETPENLIKFMQSKNGHLTHAFVDEKNGEAAKVIQNVKEKDMKLYPMYAKGDDVPTLVMSPGDPEALVRAREEPVRLGYGLSKLRHATVYFLECKPINTSIRAKHKILDVQYMLLALFITQSDIDTWLTKSAWHVPTRLVQEVAVYVKQNVDTTKTASYFELLEKQRDDAIKGREKLQLMNTNEQMNNDLDGQLMKGYRSPKGMYTFNDMVMWLIVAFIAGFAIAYLLLG